MATVFSLSKNYEIDEYKVVRDIEFKSLTSAFDATYASDYVFQGEYHNFWEFVYVVDGKIGVTADNRVFELSKGEIVFHKPMEFHKFYTISGCTLRLIIMSFTMEGKLCEKFENCVIRLCDNSKHLLKILLQLKKRNNLMEKTVETNTIPQEFSNYFELFLMSVFESDEMIETSCDNYHKNLYQKIIDTMHENIYNNLSVDEISTLCNVSTSNMKKIFHKYSGCGVSKYFLRLKIAKAIEMIQEDINISQISEKLSFNNQNYFSMAFKREMGLSPLQYKKTL